MQFILIITLTLLDLVMVIHDVDIYFVPQSQGIAYHILLCAFTRLGLEQEIAASPRLRSTV